ncbi:MAG TPA: A24 family peptidase [Gemmatimonadales bacterium]|nr:A24 family peptidase [Gemmatimonadales bacterium]
MALSLGFALIAFQRLGLTPRWLAFLPLLAALAAVVVVDLMTKRIPDIVTVPSMAYAVVVATAFGGNAALMEAGLGILVGGGLLLLLAVVTRGGIGGGDIKLVALLGSALGWKAALLAFALSQLAGGVFLLYLLVTGRAERRKTLPIGALIALIGAGLLASGG